MNKMKKRLGLVAVFLGVLFMAFAAGAKADAAALTGSTNLGAGSATITTNGAGQNVLTTNRGVTYELNADSQIYSTGAYIITLNNTAPVNIDSIYVKGALEIRGNGELNLDADGQFGINTLSTLKMFYHTQYGTGKITSKGNEAGIRASASIYTKGGVIEATGPKYGVWTNCYLYTYNNAKISGFSDNGIGIWAYSCVYSYNNSEVYGEGALIGIQAEKSCNIYAYDNSKVTGISSDGVGIWVKTYVIAYNNAAVKAEGKNYGIFSACGYVYAYNNATIDAVSSEGTGIYTYGSTLAYATSKINAEGKKYGIYAALSCNVYAYGKAEITAKSSEGMGIWAKANVIAHDQSSISGEGLLAGIFTRDCYIKACGVGARVTGISNNIYSGYSALHANAQTKACPKIYAYCNNSVVKEIYNNTDLVVDDKTPVNVVSKYTAVARNMGNMNNYSWYSVPEGVYNKGGLLADPAKPFRDGSIIGERTGTTSCKVTGEPVQVNKGGKYIVQFNEAEADLMVDVNITHTIYDYVTMTLLEVRTETVRLDPGAWFILNDHNILDDIRAEGGEPWTYSSVPSADFIVVGDGTTYTVEYTYYVEY